MKEVTNYPSSHLYAVILRQLISNVKKLMERVQKALEILSTYGIPLEQVNIQQSNIASGA